MTIQNRHKKTQKMKSDAFLHTNRSEEIRDMSKNMQNEPNLQNTPITATSFLEKHYEEYWLYPRSQNKPNSNPIRTQTNPIKPQKPTSKTQTNPIKPNFKPNFKPKNSMKIGIKEQGKISDIFISNYEVISEKAVLMFWRFLWRLH